MSENRLFFEIENCVLDLVKEDWMNEKGGNQNEKGKGDEVDRDGYIGRDGMHGIVNSV